MKFVNPADISANMIVYTNLVDESLPHWASGQSYTAGQEVIFNQRIYEALTATSDSPEDGVLKHPPSWLDRGATNSWRLFDEHLGTQSTAEGKVVVHVQPGQAISALALFNLTGALLHAELEDPKEGVVWEHEEPLVDAGAANWYEYFFKPIDRISDTVVRGVPAYSGGTLKITIDNASEIAAVGHLSVGQEIEIGHALYGTSIGIIDFSRKERDAFGRPTITRRDFSKRAEYDIAVYTEHIARIQRMLADARARPIVWIGDENKEETIILGFYKDFSIVISGPTISDATITVEGLT